MLCQENKKVYFLDSTALAGLAYQLRAVFFKNILDSKGLVPDENFLFVTDEQSLEQVEEIKVEFGIENYKAFKDFITNNFVVIPRDKTISALNEENSIRKYRTGYVIILNDEPFAGAFGALFYLQNKEKIEPILVTFEPEVERVARGLGFKIYDNEFKTGINPFFTDTCVDLYIKLLEKANKVKTTGGIKEDM